MKKLTLLTVLVLFLLNGTLKSQTGDNGRKFDVKPTPITVNKTKSETPKIFISDYDDPGNTEQYIAEDLYVLGSIGLGTSIVNNEPFGFNTILMRENNLRIMFEDNSATSNYPDNDWLIEINESADGGENYFAIQDYSALTYPFKIMAGAADNSLIVGENNNIGFGTSNPLVRLHARNGNTPGLRLEQDNSGGWTPQTWDLSGNESNFFIRDATNGSTLPFRIQPGAPTDALTIKSDGKVGIGTWSPDEELEVVGNMKLGGYLSVTPLMTVPGTPSEGDMYMDGNDHELKVFDGTNWSSASDNQNLVNASLTGTVLEIEIENGSSVSVDLYPLIEDLETRIEALEAQVGSKDVEYNSARLFQNNPNPYKDQTNISYYIPQEVKEAYLQITDIEGKEMKGITIYERGRGNIIIDESYTESGTYFYTLILDDKKLESKIMVKID